MGFVGGIIGFVLCQITGFLWFGKFFDRVWFKYAHWEKKWDDVMRIREGKPVDNPELYK